MAEVIVVEYDSTQWDALMSELNPSQLRRAYKAGMKPSAQVIQRYAVDELKSRHPAAAKYAKEVSIQVWTRGGGYTVALRQGQIALERSKSGDMVKYSHLHILRWLSTGVSNRATKKGYKRGSIEGSHFFSTAVRKSIPEAVGIVGDSITKALEKAVRRAKQKKGKL